MQCIHHNLTTNTNNQCRDSYRADDVDNDFFFVLGRVTSGAESARCTAEQVLREQLASEPLTLAVSRETLSLVAYSDPQLPPETSQAFGLNDKGATALGQMAVFDENDPS